MMAGKLFTVLSSPIDCNRSSGPCLACITEGTGSSRAPHAPLTAQENFARNHLASHHCMSSRVDAGALLLANASG